jgi:DNA-binding response OmpR family regulator
LPKLGGLEVLRQVQKQRPELPVLIVSARSDLPTKLRGFELGASDYIAKPFSFEELLARVWAQLRSVQRGGDGGVVQAGSLTLDLTRREARLGELVAELSDREFRLLSEVWGYHFDPRSNVVDVCVRRLRKKLGSDAPIETVRHGGYRLTAA